MSCFTIALLCAVLAVVSNFILKFVSRAVPIVLMGLPVIHAGLSSITVVSLLIGFGASGIVIGVLGTLAALAGGYVGHKLANRYFVESLLG